MDTGQLTDKEKLRKLRAEWYRYGLHNAMLRGEHATPADNLRVDVAHFGGRLLALTVEDD